MFVVGGKRVKWQVWPNSVGRDSPPNAGQSWCCSVSVEPSLDFVEKVRTRRSLALPNWVIRHRTPAYGLGGDAGNVIVTSTGKSAGGKLVAFGSQIRSLSWPG